MSEIVDKILSDMDKDDDIAYWAEARVADLQIIGVFPTYWAYIPTVLDGIPVTLRITYNEVDAGFFVDILSGDGSIDVKGLGIRTNSDMLDGLAFSELGRLFAIDLEREQIDPLYDSFGTRFALAYLPQASK